jgi:hypothetical protein
MNELNASWPDLLRSPLISEPITLDICPRSCQQANIERASTHQHGFHYPPSPAATSVTPPYIETCSDTMPVPGSYLPVHFMDALYPPAPLPQSFPPGEPVAGRYAFVPRDCRWNHPGLRFSNPMSCASRPRNVLIIGDSHGRVAMDGLYHRLSGQPEILAESVSSAILCNKEMTLTLSYLFRKN